MVMLYTEQNSMKVFTSDDFDALVEVAQAHSWKFLAMARR
jgi:hypothetical protein